MDIGGYSHKYQGFCENFARPLFVNMERTKTTRGTHSNIIENFPSLLFFLWVTSITEEIQSPKNHVYTTSNWRLEEFQELLQMIPVSMLFIYTRW